MRVRRANRADIPAMMALERQNPSAAHWSSQQYEALFVHTEQSSQHFAWAVDDEAAAGPEGDKVLGFLVARRIDAQWELENIVVAEVARRHGAGTRLLGDLVSYARLERGSEIFLEVRESNQAARALYCKAGFEEMGLRKSYYSNPTEDAILCRLRLS